MTYNELIQETARGLRRFYDPDVLQMCGLAASATSTKIKTVSDIVYFLNNQRATLSATDPITTTACAQQAADTFCYYLVSADISQNVTTTKGTDDDYNLPSVPANNRAIGAFLIVTVGVTFTAGTTAFDAAGVTATFYDIDTGIVARLINQAMRKFERGPMIILPTGKIIKVTNFDYMKVRTTVDLSENDYDFAHPFSSYHYKELVNAHLIDSSDIRYKELDRTIYDECIRKYPDFTNNIGRPLMIAKYPTIESSLDPDIAPTFKWLIRPTCDADYTLDISCYQYSPNLDGIIYATNWLTENFPEILMYGAWLEIAHFIKETSRRAEWKKDYNEIALEISNVQKSERFSGSKLSIKFDNALDEGNFYDITSGPY